MPLYLYQLYTNDFITSTVFDTEIAVQCLAVYFVVHACVSASSLELFSFGHVCLFVDSICVVSFSSFFFKFYFCVGFSRWPFLSFLPFSPLQPCFPRDICGFGIAGLLPMTLFFHFGVDLVSANLFFQTRSSAGYGTVFLRPSAICENHHLI